MIRLRLADILTERNMTQKQLAEETGLTPNSVSKLAGGTPRQIRLESIEAICRSLDIQPGDLFELKK